MLEFCRKTPYGKLESDYGRFGNINYVRSRFILNRRYYELQLGSKINEADNMTLRIYPTNKSFTKFDDSFKADLNYHTFHQDVNNLKIHDEVKKIIINLFDNYKNDIIESSDIPQNKCIVCGKYASLSRGNGVEVCQEHRKYIDFDNVSKFIMIEDNEDLIKELLVEGLRKAYLFTCSKYKKEKNTYACKNNTCDESVLENTSIKFNTYYNSKINGIKIYRGSIIKNNEIILVYRVER